MLNEEQNVQNMGKPAKKKKEEKEKRWIYVETGGFGSRYEGFIYSTSLSIHQIFLILSLDFGEVGGNNLSSHFIYFSFILHI